MVELSEVMKVVVEWKEVMDMVGMSELMDVELSEPMDVEVELSEVMEVVVELSEPMDMEVEWVKVTE